MLDATRDPAPEDSLRDPLPWNPPTNHPPPAPPPAASRKQEAARLLAHLLRSVDAQDLQVLAGLLLLGRGCWMLHPAAGLIAPAVVLLWWALPQRPRFVQPRPPDVRVVTPEDFMREAKRGRS